MKELFRRGPGVVGLMAFFCFSLSSNVFAQQSISSLEQRLDALEGYVETIKPTLVEFSDGMGRGISEYTQQLENSLRDYSQQLRLDLEERLQGFGQEKVILSPTTTAFQKIETNAGTLLIAVSKMESIEKGFRLHLNIGNPNYADYKDFKIKLLWGKKQVSGASLEGAEFAFQGVIAKGKWNPVEVDLVPATASQLGQIECELYISSVQMESE